MRLPDRVRRDVFAACDAGACVIRHRLDALHRPIRIRVWHTRDPRDPH
jgi:hypothetical protein